MNRIVAYLATAELRAKLQAATAKVASVQERAAGLARGGLPSGERAALVRLVVGVLATLAEIDSRLDAFADRMAQIRLRAGELADRVGLWISIARWAGIFLLVWRGLGQVLLLRYGWQKRTQASP
ncbi:MAG: hypothetical protein DWQ42_17395 [Planctomycetota bacterium]|nr:MAG: hypothetical protein DWQ42_17395 [Planctomycetota bacterium]REK41058.1 MAG: hypothetical protein DWQ46_14540 [Planctomycetota bacterium]